jgi:hypothetical protein
MKARHSLSAIGFTTFSHDVLSLFKWVVWLLVCSEQKILMKTQSSLKMKFSTLFTLLISTLVIGARLDTRQQDNCNRNECYIAVWGSDPNLVPIRGVVECERHLTTIEVVYPMYVQSDPEQILP